MESTYLNMSLTSTSPRSNSNPNKIQSPVDSSMKTHLNFSLSPTSNSNSSSNSPQKSSQMSARKEIFKCTQSGWKILTTPTGFPFKKARETVRTSKQKIACPICHCEFILKSNFKEHFKTHKFSSPNSSSMKLNSNSKSTLKSQFKMEGNIQKPRMKKKVSFVDSLEFPFHCEVCGYKTTDKSQYDRHVAGHSPLNDPGSTSLDPDAGSDPSHLRHYADFGEILWGLTVEQPRPCKLCGFEALTSVQLNSHMAHHHGGGKFLKCEFCDYTCLTSGQLVIHGRVHQDDRPFKCRKCHYRTEHPMSWERHRKSCYNSKVARKLKFYKKEEEGNLKSAFPVVFNCKAINCEYFTEKEAELAVHNLKTHKVPLLILKRLTKAELRIAQGETNLDSCSGEPVTQVASAYKAKQKRDQELKCEASNCHFEGSNDAELNYHYQKKHGMPAALVKLLRSGEN